MFAFARVLRLSGNVTSEHSRAMLHIVPESETCLWRYMPNMGIVMPYMGISATRARKKVVRSAPADRAEQSSGSIAAALFSATQQKVLGLLFGQPGRSYLTTEIIARCGGGSGGVQRELARLTAAGLVCVERVGRQAHYRVNAASPVFAELAALVRKTVGLTDPLRSALQPLADQIELALVYGSVARGEAKASSDIDVLVVSDSLQPEDLYRAFAKVELQLSRPIHPMLMHRREFQRRRSEKGSFVQRVLGDQVEWLLGGVDAIAAP
jgi:predicted nucleotidyltransferase